MNRSDTEVAGQVLLWRCLDCERVEKDGERQNRSTDRGPRCPAADERDPEGSYGYHRFAPFHYVPRADYLTLAAERDRLADALRPFLAAADEWEAKNNATFSEPADPRYDSDEWYAEIEVCNNDVRDAREALNGTTPQPSQTPERRTVETPGEQGGPAVESSHETEA